MEGRKGTLRGGRFWTRDSSGGGVFLFVVERGHLAEGREPSVGIVPDLDESDTAVLASAWFLTHARSIRPPPVAYGSRNPMYAE